MTRITHSAFVEKAFFTVVAGMGTIIIVVGSLGISVLRDMTKSIETLNERVAEVVISISYQDARLRDHARRLDRLEQKEGR